MLSLVHMQVCACYAELHGRVHLHGAYLQILHGRVHLHGAYLQMLSSNNLNVTLLPSTIAIQLCAALYGVPHTPLTGENNA